MKTLQYVVLLLTSLFAFQALLFVSTAIEARCLLLQTTMSQERNVEFLKAAGIEGRHHAPPPPKYAPGPGQVQKLNSPPSTPAADVLRHHRHSPPPPKYAPGPGQVQKLNSPPSTPAADVLRHRHSPPPTPGYNPGPSPGLLTVPATSGNPTARKHILYQNSHPNLYAASA